MSITYTHVKIGKKVTSSKDQNKYPPHAPKSH